MTVILNGKKVVQQTGHAGAVVADVRPLLKSGQNVLAVKCHNDTGPGAISIKLEIHRKDGQTFQLITDPSWTTSSAEPKGWLRPNFKNSSFVSARVHRTIRHGAVGQIERNCAGKRHSSGKSRCFPASKRN